MSMFLTGLVKPPIPEVERSLGGRQRAFVLQREGEVHAGNATALCGARAGATWLAVEWSITCPECLEIAAGRGYRVVRTPIRGASVYLITVDVGEREDSWETKATWDALETCTEWLRRFGQPWYPSKGQLACWRVELWSGEANLQAWEWNFDKQELVRCSVPGAETKEDSDAD